MSKIIFYDIGDTTIARFNEITELSISPLSLTNKLTGVISEFYPIVSTSNLINEKTIKDSTENINSGDKIFIGPGYTNNKTFIEEQIKNKGAIIVNKLKSANKIILNERCLHASCYGFVYQKNINLVTNCDINSLNINNNYSSYELAVTPLYIDIYVAMIDNNLKIINEENLISESYFDISKDKLPMLKEIYHDNKETFMTLLTNSFYEKNDYYKLWGLCKYLNLYHYDFKTKSQKLFYEKNKFIIETYSKRRLIEVLHNRDVLTKKCFNEICTEDFKNHLIKNISSNFFTVKDLEFNQEFLNNLIDD